MITIAVAVIKCACCV